MPTLEVNIGKVYPGGPDSARFELRAEFNADDGITVLFGPSGAGKTLTLDAIAGFAEPDSGFIRFHGDTLFDRAQGVNLPARSRGMGYVFQKDALFPHMTVRGNLEFPLHASSADDRNGRVADMLETFRLWHVAGRRPHEVSGGERQRCAIARALLSRPRALLLDEPARGFDIGLRTRLYEILRRVRAEFGLPMLLVTHDLEEAFELADQMAVFLAGRVVQQGPPRELYERPASAAVADLFGLTNVFEGRVADQDRAGNSTRLETERFSVTTAYLEDCKEGEPVRFCISPERVVVAPLNGNRRDGQIELALTQAVSLPNQVRLEFADLLRVHVRPETYERQRTASRWGLEFPAGSVWVFPDQG